jgi:hypothetical protein
VYRNWAYAARQFDVFNPANGFKKLGIFYSDCQPEVNAAILADLEQIGVPPGAIDRFDLGCPTSFAPPSAIEQAVVKEPSVELWYASRAPTGTTVIRSRLMLGGGGRGCGSAARLGGAEQR